MLFVASIFSMLPRLDGLLVFVENAVENGCRFIFARPVLCCFEIYAS